MLEYYLKFTWALRKKYVFFKANITTAIIPIFLRIWEWWGFRVEKVIIGKRCNFKDRKSEYKNAPDADSLQASVQNQKP